MDLLTTMSNYTEKIWERSQEYIPENRVLQPIWDYMRLEHGDFCRSPLFPVVVNVVFYFLLNIPFMIMDLMGERWPLVHQYKIQKNVKVTPQKITRAMMVTIKNQIMFVLPAAIYQWIYRPPIPLPTEAPILSEFTLGVVGNLLLFDFQYYWWHRLHHTYRFLYKYIHKIHHEHNSPCSWTTQYLSGAELMTVGFFANFNPIVLNQHFMTMHFTMTLNVLISVEAHIGYDFPFGPNAILPFSLWGGAPKHDMHHMKPLTNFAPFFSHMDNVFGTSSEGRYCKARDPLQKQREILSAMTDGSRKEIPKKSK